MQFPLSKVTLGFVSGLIISRHVVTSMTALFASLLCFIIFIVLLHFWKQRQSVQQFALSSAILILSMLIGITSAKLRQPSIDVNHYTNVPTVFDDNHNLQITLQEQLKSSEKNIRYIADVNFVDKRKTNGLLIVNIRRDSTFQKLFIGQRLQLNAKIRKHLKPQNPDQFDYGAYLVTKEIFGQIYTTSTQIISGSATKSIWFYTDKIRNTILVNLANSNLNKRELAVLSALILGQRQEIDPQIVQDYQYAGAVHILSVSGLHVGLIVLFINGILKYLRPSKSTRILRLIITLASLWIFALLASLSPSVVRAVTMFSFIAIGMSLNRSTNIYHTLLVSLLLILLVQPAFLFDIGFQLSYIALFSILWLQPILGRIWQPNNKIVKYFWDIITVSFAAQIGAFPISIYYFHQFPGLFFITNLIILPILSIIMALGIVAMLIGLFGIVPQMIITSLEYCLRIMNESIHFVATFETFVLHNIPMNSVMLVCVYLIIITLFICIERPNYRNKILVLSSILLCSAAHLVITVSTQRDRKLMVFHQKNNSVIVSVVNGLVDVTSVNTLQKWDDIAVQTYATANYYQLKNKKKMQNFHYLNSVKIAVIDSNAVWHDGAKADILLLIQSPKVNLERIIADCKPKVIVADGTNYLYLQQRWRATCDKAKIPFHNTSEKGFYLLD